jgi:uncharacterized repeat protein (TIGR01451 family)
VLSLLMQYFTFATAPAALAVHNTGLFELDGNTANDAAVAGDDWDSHPNATGNRFTFITDPLSQKTDDIFTGGASKDDLNTSGWQWTTGSVPDKDNIEHAFAASYEQDGHTFVYFGLDRFANNGDAFTGFWFFKSGVGPVAGGDFSGPHQVGDLLVLSNFTNGGDTATIELYEWVGSGGNTNGTLNKIATGNVCTGSPASDKACAVTNASPITPSWSFDDKFTDEAPNPIPKDSFFEGGIDLDQLYGGNAPCFGSFLAETRASQSVDAVLKDFSGGSFNTCVPPTITTDASVSTFHFGDAGVTDTATLSGSDGPASGVVKFFVCTPAQITGNGCPTGGTQVGAAGGVAVTTSANGGTATSAAYTPTAVGKYCFRAEYVPNAASQYLAASHTNATTECFTVVKNTTAIVTTANQTVNAGQAIADSATLSGATADAGGTITFRAYGPNDNSCANTPAFTSNAIAVSGNGSYGPVSFIPATAGTYHWIATYSGDAKNLGSAGACGDAGENDTVNKVNPAIATTASGTVIVGGNVSDTATVSGGLNPTGTVTFKLYGPNDATCATDPIFTSANRPLSGGSATSAAFTTSQVGTYRWIATYNGDANNNAVSGACNDSGETVVVNPTSPTIATTLVAGNESGTSISVPLGTSVHDTSTLTGATATAGGTVHYRVYSNATCTTLFSDAGTVPVVNGVPGNSLTVPFNTAGTYYWQADYSGDANNSSASSACNLETVSVGLTTPLISTNASASVVAGGQIHDTATLAGGFNPTGTITFRLYGPNDATCATAPVFTSTVNVSGNGDYVSSAFTTSSAGVYRWIATYNGDVNNAVVAGSCNDANENVVVTTPNLDVVKLVATNGGAFGPTSVANPGDTLHYQITISNSGNAAATNVPVSDDISAILAHASYNDDCSNGCSFAADTLTWTIPSIAAGDSVTLTFSVDLDASFPTGTTHLPNVVVVTGPGSNCAAESQDPDCATDTTVATAVLTIDKSVAGNTAGTDPDLNVPAANIGDTLTYTLHYAGAGALTGAVITDVLPDGLAYIAGSAEAGDDASDFTFVGYAEATRTLTWRGNGTDNAIPDPADGTVTYQVTVLDTAPEFAQPLTNVATIDSLQTEAVSDTASVAVLAPPQELTPPPTSTITPQTGTGNPGFALMLILLGVAGLTLGIGFITPVPARVRRRDRLG